MWILTNNQTQATIQWLVHSLVHSYQSIVYQTTDPAPDDIKPPTKHQVSDNTQIRRYISQKWKKKHKNSEQKRQEQTYLRCISSFSCLGQQEIVHNATPQMPRPPHTPSQSRGCPEAVEPP
jgi:hypothetical protein